MKTQTLALLCCPHCAGDLVIEDLVVPKRDGVQFGLVGCRRCVAKFPVIGGVLILGAPHECMDTHAETTAAAVRGGASIRDLVRLVASGRHADAFAELLVPADKDPDRLFRFPEAANETSPSRPLLPPRLQRKLDRGGRLLEAARHRLARILLDRGTSLSTAQVIELFYARFSQTEVANYFKFRFGQPRHLAALGICSVLKQSSGPLLNLACGAGHLAHYLSAGNRSVIGVDRNYFRLFLAANFIAPEADFVCTWADRPLPFRTDTFAGALCSDAFHCINDKAGCLRELGRVVRDDGLIALACTGNRDVKPNEGYELTPDGYSELCSGFAHTVLGEREIVAAYLDRQSPRLDRAEWSASMREDKWISIVMSKRPELLRTRVRFETWPHAEGVLGINPLYRVESAPGDDFVRLHFEFPSEHYRDEDGRYLDYAPRERSVPRRVLEALAAGSPIDEGAVEELVRELVLIGMPRRYVPDPFRLGIDHSAAA